MMENVKIHEEFAQSLPRYLEGTLAEQEKDRFEAHYLDCKRCAKEIHLAIEERELVDRYMMNELAPGEKEFFEKHYFACHACFEAVQQADELLGGLHYAAQEGKLVVAEKKFSLREWWQGIAARFRTAPLALAYGFAVVLLLLVYPAWRGLVELPRLERELALLKQPHANGQIYMLEQTRDERRSEDSSQAIKIPLAGVSPVPIILQFTLAEKIDAGSRYRAAILEEKNSKFIWEENNLHSSEDYAVFSITCPSSFFTPGHFLLKIQKINPENAQVLREFSFPFEIVASP